MKEWWEFIVNTNVCLKIIPLQCTRLLFSAALFVPASQSGGDPFGFCRCLHILQQLHGHVKGHPLIVEKRVCTEGLYKPNMSFQSSGHVLETFSLIFLSESLTPIPVCLKQVLNAVTPPWGRRFIVLVRTTHWPSTCIGQLVSGKAYK